MSAIRRLTVIAGAFALASSGVLGAEQIKGNWYGKAVTALEYKFTKSGTYKEVTSMDSKTGKCEQKEVHYDSPIGPYAEELSLHFRGPLILAEAAVYLLGRNGSEPQHAKRDVPVAHHHHRRHGHQHLHKAHHLHQREVGAMVTATINGEVKTWKNEYNGGAATPSPSASQNDDKAASSPSSSTPAQAAYTPSATGDFVRVAYYNGASKTAEGLVFLNNKGGQKSGVFDYKFGNSLSYASSDGETGAASPQILEGGHTLPSNTEVIIFSDKKCSNGDCGYFRPGAVAYHGFGGAEKVFLFDYKMPDDGKNGPTNENANMPAIWSLNAKIPRTGQYVSDPSCSCWKSGGGEFDIVEVLDPGNRRCKSTAHYKDAFGHSDYIERPVDKFMKLAVVFIDGAAHIKVLDDKTTFPASLSRADVKRWL